MATSRIVSVAKPFFCAVRTASSICADVIGCGDGCAWKNLGCEVQGGFRRLHLMLIAPRKVANGFPTLRRTRSKLVQRRSDASDRRKVLVEATDKTRELIRGTYVPIAQAGVKMLASYSVAELTAIGRFVEDALVLQQRMTTKLLERKQKN
jgi:hypothetical protein